MLKLTGASNDRYDPQTLAHLLAEADAVEAAVRESVHDALLMHKRLGNPVATWENGRVVWVPAADIAVHSNPVPVDGRLLASLGCRPVLVAINDQEV